MKERIIIYCLCVLCSILSGMAQTSTADVSNCDYALYTHDMPAMAGRQMTMALSMKNATLISGYQADLVLPDGFSVATITGEFGDTYPLATILRSTTARHNLDVSKVEEGVYRILSTSIGNLNYVGYDGIVAYITIDVASNVNDGEYAIKIVNQEMGEITNAHHDLDEFTATITVKNPQFVVDEPQASIAPTDIEQLDNALYTSSMTAYRGKRTGMELRLKNADAVTGFQVDVLLPHGFTLAKNTDGTPMIEAGERCAPSSGHVFNIAQQADGSYRIICVSSSNRDIDGSDGLVAIVYFDVDEDLSVGNYRAVLRNQELGSSSNQSIAPMDVTNSVAVMDYGCTYDLINLQPYTLYANSIGVKAGHQITVHFGMLNMKSICGFQADLVLPKGITVAMKKDGFGGSVPAISFVGRTTSSRHSISCVQQEDGTYRVLCASMDNKEFLGHFGDLFTITFDVASSMKKDSYPIYIKNQEFGESDNTKHLIKLPFVSKIYIRSIPPLIGDTNGDGIVDVNDVLAIPKLLLHKDTDNIDEESADTNEDGHFSIGDIVKIINSINKK